MKDLECYQTITGEWCGEIDEHKIISLLKQEYPESRYTLRYSVDGEQWFITRVV